MQPDTYVPEITAISMRDEVNVIESFNIILIPIAVAKSEHSKNAPASSRKIIRTCLYSWSESFCTNEFLVIFNV